MKRYLAGLLVISLCMGQNCSSLVVSALETALSGDSTSDTTTTGDSTGDTTTTGDGADTTTSQGIPDGTYTGAQTTVQVLDNLDDGLAAESHTSTASATYTFGQQGRLVRADGTAIAVGDVEQVATQFGTVAETVTAVNVGVNLAQYVTQPQMSMATAVPGVSTIFAGSGVHTYRLSGEKVIYTGRLDMSSDASGGAAYQPSIEYSATLTKSAS